MYFTELKILEGTKRLAEADCNSDADPSGTINNVQTWISTGVCLPGSHLYFMDSRIGGPKSLSTYGLHSRVLRHVNIMCKPYACCYCIFASITEA